jgi:hypothetical protein
VSASIIQDVAASLRASSHSIVKLRQSEKRSLVVERVANYLLLKETIDYMILTENFKLMMMKARVN